MTNELPIINVQNVNSNKYTERSTSTNAMTKFNFTII